MESKDLIIRCSALGSIMTNARSKSVALSQTCKSHIQERFNELEFGITDYWTNQYVQKGTSEEDVSLMMAQRVHKWEFMSKNEERFTNEFITGEPDAINDDFVLEIKSSWSMKTFPMYAETNPNKGYEWQLQGYLWLTGKEVGYLSYCLVDTPEMLVIDELYRTARNQGFIDLPPKVEKEIRDNHSFGHVPEHLRIKTFEIRRDEEKIEQIKERVNECRNYYNELKLKLEIV